MKLIFSNYKMLQDSRFPPDKKEKYIVYNLNSLYEGPFKLASLMPINFAINTNNIDSREFDRNYAVYLQQNDQAFLDLMKILYPLYEGDNVLILVNMQIEINEVIVESLIKYLQQMYGISSNYAEEFEDLENIPECAFSVQGLEKLDYDRARYVKTLERMHIL